MKLKKSYKNKYFWYVIKDCLSFCNYHVGLVVPWPDRPLRESFDLELFILGFQECLSYN